MRSRAAAHGSETDDRSSFHRRGVGSCQVFRDQHRALRIGRRHLLDAGEVKKNALTDIAHVVGALCEELVSQGGETIRVQLGRFLPGESRALALRNGRVGNIEKVRIIEQLGVRGEDRGFRGISLRMQRGTQRLELTARPPDRMNEALLFVLHAAAFFFDHDLGTPDLISIPDGQARRSSYT